MGKINDLLGSKVTKKDEAVDAGKIIKELIATGFSKDNASQMKAVQLLKGLATSDDPKSNDFMKKLDAFTSKMKSEEYDDDMDDEEEKEDDDDNEGDD